jgi:hypothetical protein
MVGTPAHMRPTRMQISPAQIEKQCPYCKTSYWITKSAAGRHIFCSRQCGKRSRAQKKAYVKAAEIVKLSEEAKELGTLILENRVPTREYSVLTPQFSSMIRGKIASVVHDHLLIAEKVLTGEVTWSTGQVSLFKALLAKVVPDVSATYHQHELNSRTTTEMSREELEALAASQAIGATIDHQEHPEGRPPVLDDPSGVRPSHVRLGPVIHTSPWKEASRPRPPGEDHDPEDP